MSTSNYTRIENTLVSGSELFSDLSNADVRMINFHGALSRSDPINVTSASPAATITINQLVQSVVNTQLVSGVTLNASGSILFGPDAASQAAAYINLFNLSSGVENKKLLNFQVTGATNAAQTVSIANTSSSTSGTGTNNFVKFDLASASIGFSKVLFIASALAGARSTVEVFATNTSAGSEAVIFNICQVNQT